MMASGDFDLGDLDLARDDARFAAVFRLAFALDLAFITAISRKKNPSTVGPAEGASDGGERAIYIFSRLILSRSSLALLRLVIVIVVAFALVGLTRALALVTEAAVARLVLAALLRATIEVIAVLLALLRLVRVLLALLRLVRVLLLILLALLSGLRLLLIIAVASKLVLVLLVHNNTLHLLNRLS